MDGFSSAPAADRESSDAHPRGPDPPSADRTGRILRGAGVFLTAGALLTTIALWSAPRPDATLQLTGTEAGDRIVTSTEELMWLSIDGSTLRNHGSYAGFDLWSAENAFDSPCLVAVTRTLQTISEASCAPLPANVFVDVSLEGQSFDDHPGSGIIRFVLHGDVVEAFIHDRETGP